MLLKFKRYVPRYDFRKLSHLDGSLTRLAKKYKLRESETIVLTSRGEHRIRFLAIIGHRPTLFIPEIADKGSEPLQVLMKWMALALRDGVVCLNEYRRLHDRSKRIAA